MKFVINTHWHGDHTGGNEPFGKAGAVIIAQDNVRARMSTEQFMAAFNQKIPPAPAAALPTITFPTRATFHWNGNIVNVAPCRERAYRRRLGRAFHELNVIHTGDTFVKDQYPFIDCSSNGVLDGFIKSRRDRARAQRREYEDHPGPRARSRTAPTCSASTTCSSACARSSRR